MGYDIEKEKEKLEAGRRALNSLSAKRESEQCKNWGLVDMFWWRVFQYDAETF